MSAVLVIDDEPIVRDLMVEILREAGYETEAAGTAEAGLELIEDERIAIVVSDIHMPGLSGLELLQAVRSARPSLPVVLVTGAGTYGNLTEAVSRGADGFVMKPFSHAELERAVASAFDRAGRSEREPPQADLPQSRHERPAGDAGRRDDRGRPRLQRRVGRGQRRR